MSSSSNDSRATSRIPVSGIAESICVSHVAMTRHDFAVSKELLLRHSSKALNMEPFSWLQRTKATLLCQELIAASSSSYLIKKDSGMSVWTMEICQLQNIYRMKMSYSS